MAITGLALLAGCATPTPILTDFSEIKAEVRVQYDNLRWPSLKEARQLADPVAAEHCRSLGKTPVYVSGREEVDHLGR